MVPILHDQSVSFVSGDEETQHSGAGWNDFSAPALYLPGCGIYLPLEVGRVGSRWNFFLAWYIQFDPELGWGQNGLSVPPNGEHDNFYHFV